MSAAVRTAQPTCALVFAEETLIRRNGIPQKLAERGLLIKKQVAANSRAFEFSTVDLVIVIADGVTSGQSSVIRAAAKYANVDVLFLPHQASRWGEALHGYASAPPQSTLSLVKLDAENDKDAGELYAMVEKERDEAKAQVQKLTGELGNVRADRERLIAERDAANGAVVRLEVQLGEAQLGLGEARTEREAATALRERLVALEADLNASWQQNERLVRERDAALEAADRQEGRSESLADLEGQLAAMKVERDSYMNKFRMASAREAQASTRAKVAEEAQREAPKVVTDRMRALQAEVERVTSERDRLVEAVRTAPKPAPARRADLDEVAGALRALSKAKLLTAEDAFDKLLEAIR